MEIRPVVAESFHEDANSRFSQSCKCT